MHRQEEYETYARRRNLELDQIEFFTEAFLPYLRANHAEHPYYRSIERMARECQNERSKARGRFLKMLKDLGQYHLTPRRIYTYAESVQFRTNDNKKICSCAELRPTTE